ncbi:MAG TPA: TadE family protein [Acidimicrobiales bacterium]|nr:TadE family protein [Acidimicrobiales bacterium]
MSARGRRGRVGERGQAAVELALVLPLVVTLALLVAQVGLVVRDQVHVTHAAREAVRRAAVDPDPAAARAAALAGSPLDPGRLQVEVGRRGAPGEQVRVVVRYRSPVRVPGLSTLRSEVGLSDSAAMRVEK